MKRPLVPLVLAPLVALFAACDDKLIREDGESPVVEITSPEEFAVVSGVAFLAEATATDDVGVSRVMFRLGTQDSVEVTQAPYAVWIVTAADSAGAEFALVAEAFDADGNSSIDQVPVTVGSRLITRLTNDPNDDMNPSWSPDGSQIVFQAKRAVGTFDIWMMNADGSSQTQWTTNSQNDENPAFSPDGESIAFDSNRMGTYDLFRMAVASGESSATALTFGNNDDRKPAWSPDGSWITFASTRGDEGDSNLWRLPATGGDSLAVQLTSFDEEDTAPAVARPSGMVSFASNLNFGSQPHIYTLNPSDNSVAPLTGDLGVSETDPDWFPGGNMILFSREDGVDSNLWIQGSSGGAARQVTFGSGNLGDGGGVWSPDGTKIAFHSDRDGNLEIYVME